MRLRDLAASLFLLAVACGLAVFFTWPHMEEEPSPVGITDARGAFSAGDFALAFRLAEEILQRDNVEPIAGNPNVEALLLAGESATQLQRYDDALSFYARVPDDASKSAVARWAAGEIHLHLGQTGAAFAAITASLQRDPDLMPAHQRMIELCNELGRRRESLPSLMFMLRSHQIRREYLLFLGNLTKATYSAERLAAYKKQTPDDLMPNLALAQLAIEAGALSEADRLLAALLAEQPDLLEAHVQQGFVLLEIDRSRLDDWHRKLPAEADDHPDIWFVRAASLRETQPDQAIRCFAEAIRRDPNHLKSHAAMAEMLARQDMPQRAEPFANRLQQLQQLNITLERIYQSPEDPSLLQSAAELSWQLGRLWECVGWCIVAKTGFPQLDWPAKITNRVYAQPHPPDMPQTIVDHNLVLTNPWLNDYPLPSSFATAPRQNPIAVNRPGSAGKIAFRDIAAEVGLQFEFDNHRSGSHQGHRMYQTTGGGIGVVDYDNDGRPDLFFTQGGDFPADPSSDSHRDSMFANRPTEDGLRMKDVTAVAGLDDHAFGQGVAVGDINGDGFDDLYVGNIGENQLWINRGDGTFANGNNLLPADDSWTSSVMIADLNLDSRPEIYDANYLAGTEVYRRMCQIGGEPRSCSPLDFTPAADRLLSMDADGKLRSVELDESMRGNSFGLVAMQMAGQKEPSLFVAADQQANLLGKVEFIDGDRDNFTLKNRAILNGCAYDNDGRAQACMGIAAGDADGDGEIDLYVTNFYDEYNTLYLQTGGLFSDRTAGSGTIAATKPQLGFGTQFFDAQRDGVPDLFVINGHIDDQTHVGVPESMPPQFFQGLGQGHFEWKPCPEASESSYADYRCQNRIGRSLVTVDIDLDGKVDLVSGHLEDTAASLVRNECEPIGSYLQLRLVGTRSDRNAFFTRATLRGGDYEQQLQLTAGSGYQASNQRVLNFAIPAAQLPAENKLQLSIQWPSGLEETHHQLKADRCYLAVEAAGIQVQHDNH